MRENTRLLVSVEAQSLLCRSADLSTDWRSFVLLTAAPLATESSVERHPGSPSTPVQQSKKLSAAGLVVVPSFTLSFLFSSVTPPSPNAASQTKMSHRNTSLSSPPAPTCVLPLPPFHQNRCTKRCTRKTKSCMPFAYTRGLTLTIKNTKK